MTPTIDVIQEFFDACDSQDVRAGAIRYKLTQHILHKIVAEVSALEADNERLKENLSLAKIACEEVGRTNERLKAELADHENREAAVCPEDWAFDDYIKHLESKLTAAKAEAEELRRQLEQMRHTF